MLGLMKTPRTPNTLFNLISAPMFASALVAALSLGCTRKSSESADGATAKTTSSAEVLIGEYGSFTGSEATFGINTSNGIKMAIAEWNEKGGVKGKKIVLRSLDDQGKS